MEKMRSLKLLLKYSSFTVLTEFCYTLDRKGKDMLIVIVTAQVVMEKGLEEEVAYLLKGVDIDGSNTLDYREFLAATMDGSVFAREENMRRGYVS